MADRRDVEAATEAESEYRANESDQVNRTERRQTPPVSPSSEHGTASERSSSETEYPDAPSDAPNG